MEDNHQINYELDIKTEELDNDSKDGANNLLTKNVCKFDMEKPALDAMKLCNNVEKVWKLSTTFTNSGRRTTGLYKTLDGLESSDEHIDNSDGDWRPNKKKNKKVPRVNRVVKPKSHEVIKNTMMVSRKEDTLDEKKINNDIIEKSEILYEEPVEALSKVDKLTCPYCGLKATFSGNLKRHIRHFHLKQNIFKCTFCKYQTYRIDHLKLHVNMKHTKKDKFKCSFCDFEALSPNTLKNHLNHIHTLHRWYECEFCEFKTTHSGNLKVHIQGKHQNVELKCHLCNFVASKHFSLSVHIVQMHKSEKLQCSFCNHISKTKACLTKHILKEHPKEVKFKCELCAYRGFTESSIKAHMVSKHQDGNQNYMCPDCDTTYDCFANLKKHRNVKHT